MNSWTGPLCALGSAFTWASGSTVYSRLSQAYSPYSVNYMRALIALPFFILATFVLAGGWQAGWESYSGLKTTHLIWCCVSMIASYGFGDILFLRSTGSLGVPGALALASSYPLLTALFGVFWLGERLSLLQGLGLLIAVVGVVTVILKGPASSREKVGSVESERLRLLRGVALGVGASLCWALNSLAVAKGGENLPTSVGNTVRMFYALIACAAIGKALQPRQALHLPRMEMSRWLWLFVLESFGGAYLFMYGLSHSPLAVASTLSSLAPVISVPVALIAGLEKFSVIRTFGICATVLGIALLLGG